MYRRRRIKREIAFSFDSFLDVVANVCGIIIRLILVAWVGARSYHAVMAQQAMDTLPEMTELAQAEFGPISNPLEKSLSDHRGRLTDYESRILEQMDRLKALQTSNAEAASKLAVLAEVQTAANEKRAALESAVAATSNQGQRAALSLAELAKRSEQLQAELRELEKSSPPTKTLRYRTPVSRPVHTEELHFECRDGRISFVDVQAFLIEVRRSFQEKAELLKTRWVVESTTGTIGAFRLHYVVEREKGLLDAVGLPNPDASFRYGLSAWAVEPIHSARGEPGKTALAPGSDLRRLVDSLDPETSVITLWVYPDSFTLYREVRDYLHDRGIEVAGRPLPDGVPIASSKHGSASRVQ